jgi:hypothetical protein
MLVRTFPLRPLTFGLLNASFHTSPDWSDTRLTPLQRFLRTRGAAGVLLHQPPRSSWPVQETPARRLPHLLPRVRRQASRGTPCCSAPKSSLDSCKRRRTPPETIVRRRGASNSPPANDASSAGHRPRRPSTARASALLSWTQHRATPAWDAESVAVWCTQK